MTPDLLGIAAVLASIVVFFGTWVMARKQSLVSRAALLGLFTLLSIPALMSAAYYRHALPEMAWFYTLRSWPGSEFVAVFVGGAGGCVAAFLPRLLMGFPLFAVIAITVVPYLKPIISPLPPASLSDQWQDGVCRQSTLATCGPASICTILKFLGTDATEKEVAKAAFTYTGGTEAWYLARYVRTRGFTPRFDFRDTFSTEVSLPAMVGVRNYGMGHFIAVLAVRGDEVTIGDPMAGLEHLTMDQFRKRYAFTGFHLSVLK